MPQSISAHDIGASAARDLRAIRSLMERANIYEAISEPTALFAGMLALGVGVAGARFGVTGYGFLGLSLSLFLAVNIFNGLALARKARRRNEPFVSEGMKLTLRAVSPPLATGAILGAYFHEDPADAAALLMIFYGLALSATRSFAPPSLALLGIVFCATGIFLITLAIPRHGIDQHPFAWLSMAATFGLFHIAYAAVLFLARRTSPSQVSEIPSPPPTDV